ncbi:hypothetical protein PAMC26510_37715 [Caballeronia sordidicola]|uniref:Uncharacterized protein n=1 Tax=Caballeronia sordidicola TaxID=196367 RepID=A0A2C9XVZ5_CABSO|nr:hypothetical protein PAMC26510_37715 [Caballeronia sordidicola]
MMNRFGIGAFYDAEFVTLNLCKAILHDAFKGGLGCIFLSQLNWLGPRRRV